MKLGTQVADTRRIICRLGPTCETPPGGRHLEFHNGRHIRHIFAYNFETETDRNVIPVPTRTFLGSMNLVKRYKLNI